MLLNFSLQTVTFLENEEFSKITSHLPWGTTDRHGILGLHIWEGELCLFQEQNLKNLTYKSFDTF